MRIQSIFFNNPDHYPPMISASRILDTVVEAHEILAREYILATLPSETISYGDHTRVIRFDLQRHRSGLQYLLFTLKVLQCASFKPDIVIGYDAHGLISAWLLSVFTRSPFIYHCHDFLDASEVRTASQRIIKWLERKVAPNIADVIVPDKERADVMAEQLKLRHAPLVVANAPLTAPSPSTRLQDTLAEQGKSFSQVVFRQGRIGPNHALDVTLRSMPMWADPSWGFVIMGPAEPTYRDHLVDLATSLGVAERFVILPAVPYPQVAQYTVGADLGHGLYEPNHVNNRYITMASNKIMEYIAAGLPMLLSESSGSRALLEKYQVGATADIASAESVAESVNTILSSSYRVAEMRAASKRAFREEFNYAYQYAPVIERFRELTLGKSNV